MAITIQEIASAFGVETQQLVNILGTGAKTLINERALVSANAAIIQAQANSDNLLSVARQQLADLQASINIREAAHSDAIRQLIAIRDAAETRELNSEPDLNAIIALIE